MAVRTLLNVLSNDGTVLSLVGGQDFRITPVIRTQDQALPAVTLTRTNVEPIDLLAEPSPIANNTVQVQSWDMTYAGARALADACRAAIENAGYTYLSEVDNFDASAELSGTYCVTQEFSVWL